MPHPERYRGLAEEAPSPADAPSGGDAPEPVGGSGEAGARSRAETVLLVEDEPSVLRLVRSTLEAEGYAVIAAAEGAEALARADAHEGPVELLLTDVVMPHMSGPELARALRARRPGTRVLFMSGYAEESARPKRGGEGECALLEKPFRPRELLDAVRRALEGAAPGSGRGAD